MNETLNYVLNKFQLDSVPKTCEKYGFGHINVTYLVVTESGRRYILQKINETVFRDVDGLMENIIRVTAHQHKLCDDPRCALTLIPTYDGTEYIKDETGAWRVYDFIEDSLCLQQPETDSDFYQSAVGFGMFQQQLAEFAADTLHESIPNFHNTPDRYRIFKETLSRDPVNRANALSKEIDFFLSHEEEMTTLQSLRMTGELPLRVTHNDTKLNNVLLDSKTRQALCVIDLDTVMPGLSLYDFGDSIRFGAASVKEDEQDLDKMNIRLDRYKAFSEGFIGSCPGLTKEELHYLPLGAKTMTLECGLRFLTDYLDGDHYFSVHYPEHNLHRAHTQMKLIEDMEYNWDSMRSIIDEIVKLLASGNFNQRTSARNNHFKSVTSNQKKSEIYNQNQLFKQIFMQIIIM